MTENEKMTPLQARAKLLRGVQTTDAFMNNLARTGYGTPNLLEGTQYPLTRLTNNVQLINSLYRNNWIIRRIVDTIPEDMTRNWIRIRSQLEPEQIERLDKAFKRKRIKEQVLHGLKWGRLYGGAAGLMMIKGHEDILDEPLDYDLVMPDSLAGIMIIDRWVGVFPSEELEEDPADNEFGLPKYYEVTLTSGEVVRVHHSRVLRFVGPRLPYWEQLAEVYWGESVVEIVYEELKKRDNASFNIANLLFRANISVLKMGDLGELLASADQTRAQDVYNTIQAQNWLMSNQGLFILSSEDEFQQYQYQFGGINDIYQSFMMDVSGAAEMPVTKLFGRSPAGMNATGESDMQNYYEVVEQKRESMLSPVLQKLLPVLCMSELGSIPDDLDFDYNPIQTPDEKDIADLVQQKVGALVNLLNAGAIPQRIVLQELRQMGDTTGMFTNITDEDIENAEDTTTIGEALPTDALQNVGTAPPYRTDVSRSGAHDASISARFRRWRQSFFDHSGSKKRR